ncbi:acyl carrier protein [Nocardia sp. NPDC051832]|uniref:acyl carrier protein n=1 Tax=Nocardia sp. NPDC051832 TaxID=3155673 RepID=UPI00343A66A0
MVLEKVSELVRASLQIPDVDPDTPLADYGMDSVRSVNLIVELETLFHVEISDEEAAGLRSTREIAEHLAGKAATATGAG